MTAPEPEPMILVRATELAGRPVVSITEGDALADIKDVLYSPEHGKVTGFTLNKRGGLFAGPLKVGLALEDVFAIGRDAVMVSSSDVLGGDTARAVRSGAAGDKHRDVMANQVLTDAGDRLGEVTDLVLEAGVVGRSGGSSRPGDVVGYQLRTDDAASSGNEDRQQFVPLPFTLAVSGTNLVVPAEVRPFIRDDLSGFGGAVDSFRAQLGPAPTGGSER